eukprot:jgi/Mesvir1/5371/Mv15452-RA.1
MRRWIPLNTATKACRLRKFWERKPEGRWNFFATSNKPIVEEGWEGYATVSVPLLETCRPKIRLAEGGVGSQSCSQHPEAAFQEQHSAAAWFGAQLARLGIRDGEKVAIAVSGGADSMALACLASFWERRLSSPGHVVAMIFDHKLRSNSSEEAAAVACALRAMGLADVLVLPCTTSLPSTGNVQSWARRARYHALAQECSSRGLRLLLTGHHADDQLETFLLRTSHASGLWGLACMSELHLMGPLAWRGAREPPLVAGAPRVCGPELHHAPGIGMPMHRGSHPSGTDINSSSSEAADLVMAPWTPCQTSEGSLCDDGNGAMCWTTAVPGLGGGCPCPVAKAGAGGGDGSHVGADGSSSVPPWTAPAVSDARVALLSAKVAPRCDQLASPVPHEGPPPRHVARRGRNGEAALRKATEWALCEETLYGSSPFDTALCDPSPPWLGQGGSLLIGRPLLRVPKRSLRSLCERHDVAWFEDPTNASLKYARNRVRAVLASGRREATPIPSLGPSGDPATIDRAPEEPGSFPLEKPFISGVGELGHDEASPSAFPLADLRRVVALCQRVRVETTNVVAALVASVASVTPYGTVLVDVVALRVMAEGRGGVGSAAAATAEATAEAEAEGAAAIDDELGALGQMEVEGDTFEGRETCGRGRPARVVGEEGGVTRGGERGEPVRRCWQGGREAGGEGRGQGGGNRQGCVQDGGGGEGRRESGQGGDRERLAEQGEGQGEGQGGEEEGRRSKEEESGKGGRGVGVVQGGATSAATGAPWQATAGAIGRAAAGRSLPGDALCRWSTPRSHAIALRALSCLLQFVSQSAYPPRLRSTRELYARLLRHPARGGQKRVLDNVNPGADGGMPLAVSAPALPFVAGGTRVEWWMGEGQGRAADSIVYPHGRVPLCIHGNDSSSSSNDNNSIGDCRNSGTASRDANRGTRADSSVQGTRPCSPPPPPAAMAHQQSSSRSTLSDDVILIMPVSRPHGGKEHPGNEHPGWVPLPWGGSVRFDSRFVLRFRQPAGEARPLPCPCDAPSQGLTTGLLSKAGWVGEHEEECEGQGSRGSLKQAAVVNRQQASTVAGGPPLGAPNTCSCEAHGIFVRHLRATDWQALEHWSRGVADDVDGACVPELGSGNGGRVGPGTAGCVRPCDPPPGIPGSVSGCGYEGCCHHLFAVAHEDENGLSRGNDPVRVVDELPMDPRKEWLPHSLHQGTLGLFRDLDYVSIGPQPQALSPEQHQENLSLRWSTARAAASATSMAKAHHLSLHVLETLPVLCDASGDLLAIPHLGFSRCFPLYMVEVQFCPLSPLQHVIYGGWGWNVGWPFDT